MRDTDCTRRHIRDFGCGCSLSYLCDSDCSWRHLGYSHCILGTYVTLAAPGDTYVTSAAAAALDIYVTPTAAGGTWVVPNASGGT